MEMYAETYLKIVSQLIDLLLTISGQIFRRGRHASDRISEKNIESTSSSKSKTTIRRLYGPDVANE